MSQHWPTTISKAFWVFPKREHPDEIIVVPIWWSPCNNWDHYPNPAPWDLVAPNGNPPSTSRDSLSLSFLTILYVLSLQESSMFLFGDYPTDFKGIASFAKQQHHLRRCHCKCSNVKGDPPKKRVIHLSNMAMGLWWKPWYLVNKIGGKWMFIPKYGIIGFDPWPYQSFYVFFHIS